MAERGEPIHRTQILLLNAAAETTPVRMSTLTCKED